MLASLPMIMPHKHSFIYSLVCTLRHSRLLDILSVLFLAKTFCFVNKLRNEQQICVFEFEPKLKLINKMRFERWSRVQRFAFEKDWRFPQRPSNASLQSNGRSLNENIQMRAHRQSSSAFWLIFDFRFDDKFPLFCAQWLFNWPLVVSWIFIIVHALRSYEFELNSLP